MAEAEKGVMQLESEVRNIESEVWRIEQAILGAQKQREGLLQQRVEKVNEIARLKEQGPVKVEQGEEGNTTEG